MLIQTKIFFILLTIILIMIGSEYNNYTVHKKDYKEFIEYSVNSTISKIKDDINKAEDMALLSVKFKYKVFKAVHRYAIEELKKDPKLDLNQLKKELDLKFSTKLIRTHLYLINSDYVIYDTTYKKDLNLDMSNFLGAKEYINRARENKKEISIANPSFDILSKNYMIYSYALLDDEKKVVLEIGFFDQMASEIKASLYNFNVSNSIVKKVELFSDYGNYIINSTEHKEIKNISKDEFVKQRMKTKDKEFAIVKEVSRTNKTHSHNLEVDNKTYRVSYTSIGNRNISKTKVKSYVLKTKLDITSFEKKLEKLENYLYFTIFSSILLMAIYYLLLIKYFMNPVHEILNSMKSWKKIDNQKLLANNDELSQIAKSFNKTFDEQTKRVLELREKDRMIIQQSKLASMGEMIGNIAHQWRQPLNALSLTVQKVKMLYDHDMLTDEKLDKSVEKSKMLINGMSATIDDFRNFFKSDKVKKIFTLNDAIDETLLLLEASLKSHDIKVDITNTDAKIELLGYKNKLEQVLLNIINNAKDALIENKILNSKIEIRTFSSQENITIEIFDNAGGVPKNIIDKIFDPYFTTKEQGKGTGIGLYMSRMIVETNMDGKLSVSNSENGAKFTIKIKVE